MLIYEAIAKVKTLTGAVLPDAVYIRWLSELDGQLAVEFYGADAWSPYDPVEDLGAELLIPFPWDGWCYVPYLEAQTYHSNGEYDRYENARTQMDDGISDFRKFMRRIYFPINRDMLVTNRLDETCLQTGHIKWFYLSAFSLAVKHGFRGTEAEWLESLGAIPGPTGPQGPEGPPGEDYSPYKATALDFSEWDDGGYEETLDDGTVNTFTVGFDQYNRPISLSNRDGEGIIITW